MQKPTLTNKTKSKVLLVLAIGVIMVSIPLGTQNVPEEQRIYYGIHVVSLILGSFLSIISVLAYFEFNTQRLMLVSFAFIAITLAEVTSIVNFVLPFFDAAYGVHGFITHGLILLMLSFFAVGIFRSD
jgi:hypothetical protein